MRGLPISCFLTHVSDTLEGLIEHTAEARWLSVLGGGVGGHWSSVRGASDKSPGAIPFIKTMDSDMEAYRQGRVRRGSYAAYLDVSHPDVMEFISLRKEGSGDETRKCHSSGFNHAVNITDDFMQAVVEGRDWNLIDPNDKTVRDTLPARQLWEEILETRYRTGEPYLFFIDTAMRSFPQAQKNLGLKLRGSNLCVAPETQILTDKGYFPIASMVGREVNVWNGQEWSATTVQQTGKSQSLLTVMFSDGSSLDCTPYHKFYVQNGYMGVKSRRALAKGTSGKVVETRAALLKSGDKLLKWELPVIRDGEKWSNAYLRRGTSPAYVPSAEKKPLNRAPGTIRSATKSRFFP